MSKPRFSGAVVLNQDVDWRKTNAEMDPIKCSAGNRQSSKGDGWTLSDKVCVRCQRDTIEKQMIFLSTRNHANAGLFLTWKKREGERKKTRSPISSLESPWQCLYRQHARLGSTPVAYPLVCRGSMLNTDLSLFRAGYSPDINAFWKTSSIWKTASEPHSLDNESYPLESNSKECILLERMRVTYATYIPV